MNLFFPVDCPVCGKYGGVAARNGLCGKCRVLFKPVNALGCVFCGRPMSTGSVELCRLCKNKSSHLDYFYTVFHYESAVREVIKKFKYGNASYLGGFLSEYLINFFCDVIAEEVSNAVIVPVPLHPQRLKERNYNQSEIIAAFLSKSSGIKMEAQALKRVKKTKPQFISGRSERFENMKGAFEPGKRIAWAENIILLDDVATTGATMQEAAKALRKVSRAKIIALVLAHGRLKRGKV
ncbi:MAG: ComF family protein [Elusimicrobiota bacterium]